MPIFSKEILILVAICGLSFVKMWQMLNKGLTLTEFVDQGLTYRNGSSFHFIIEFFTFLAWDYLVLHMTSLVTPRHESEGCVVECQVVPDNEARVDGYDRRIDDIIRSEEDLY
ncbi:uncharacterized protein BX664DRAFT_310295 [Halteromyces radiatus]|uniref:uncharacterized protein n=1 Tax=Halteromyces radiatus TaxID=101107 RepID=UPI00221F4BB9|nr:uncharacterized protein BX664DRAFT_310295 [Halteromyces radiatus]KAI8099310.1 hypothetical protein BX664DRAFT_310295 [Halteromyces radiatus]